MDAADAAALVAPLRPWIGVFMRHHASSCALKNPARTEQGVVFRFECEPIREKDERAVVKLREAIDLVYRALSLHTGIALYFPEETDDSMWRSMSGLSNASIQRQLQRDAPFEMEISVSARWLKETTLLKRKIGDEFLVELSHTPSTDAEFLEARAHLDALLEAKKPRWADPVTLNPIKLKCFLDTAKPLKMTVPQAEVFFGQLAAFTDVLDKFEPPSFRPPHHLPLRPEIALIQLAPVPIAPCIATAVSPMVDMQRASSKLTCVIIDPRLVTCSREELSTFLRAFRATTVELLPAGFATEETVPMDMGVDVTQLVEDLLTAISDCETVTSLQIGGLLMLCSSPRSRSHILQALVATVMTRVQPLTLVFGLGEAGAFDGRYLTLIVQHWKQKYPEKKLRLKRLVLRYYDWNGVFTNAILDALDGVEELSISNRDEDAPRISTQRVSDLLRKFTTLRELTLGRVDLDSMRVVSENAPPTLESISLLGLRLGDQQSFIEFIEELGCPERPLARQLRSLSLADFSLAGNDAHFRLGELEVASLERTLRVNRVLQSVRVVLAEENIIEHMVILHSAAGSLIPAPPDVRLSSEEKNRRVAFLSVLREMQAGSSSRQLPMLDTFLTGHIFAFSDPCVERFIYTH